MSQTLTRRGLVAAAPAAIVAAALPAFAAGTLDHADAELFALREPYERTLAGIAAVSPAHSRAEEAVAAAVRAHPERGRDEIEQELGFDVVEARYDAAVDANMDVINQIADTPARTMEGLFFKAKVAERESYDMDLAASIVADLVAMAGGSDA